MTFKSDIMPWSSQLEEDCAKLAVDAETPDDEILIAMVRVSRICAQATEVYQHLLEAPEKGAHAIMHISPLKSFLDELKASLSARQIHHRTVASFLYGAEVAIYELALICPPAPSLTFNALLDHKRIEYLVTCVQVCKLAAEYYLASDLVHVTMASGLIFSNGLKVLHKLSTLQYPNWDTSIVRGSVDLVELTQHCASVADACNERLKGETGYDSVFHVAAKTLRETAPSWRFVGAQEQQVNGDAALENWAGVETMGFPPIDFSDDFWLNAPFDL
jgi:hypothetical protein